MSFRAALAALLVPAMACAASLDDLKPAPAGANTLSEAEKAEGWTLLWDGTNNVWWVSKKNLTSFPEKGWVARDGWLGMKKKGGGGDIGTVAKFRDFAFKFDFQLTKGANSGVKYFFDEGQNGGTCEEYQVLENAHPDSRRGKDGNRKCASLYDLIPAKADAIVKGPGEWNTGMIVAKGNVVEHWLNGRRVLSYTRGSEEFRAKVAASKYAKLGKDAKAEPQPWGEVPEGRLLLQDHGDSYAAFCNLKLRKL